VTERKTALFDKEPGMGLKYRKMLFVALCGGLLLQTTAATSCQDTIVPAVTDLLISYGLQILLSGLTT
jgi:hypothetical protein